jgi:Na+/H+ antiporter NhaD/arsenite permease-like protein
MTGLVLGVFIATYVGMALGRVPGLRIDRTGIALIAATVLIASGAVALDAAAGFVDLATMMLLFGLMILSAQFGVSGFYDGCAALVTRMARRPQMLLAAIIVVGAGLSAVLVNDIIAFAMTPLLCAGLRARGLNPVPFLIALACATNAGSAMTVIGNPQNILIGQVGRLDFLTFVAICAPPALVCLGVIYAVVAVQWRGRWSDGASGSAAPGAVAAADGTPIFSDRTQFTKALAATIVLLALFLTPVPREIAALAVAALLLASRRVASRDMIGAVDWNLLLLFVGLFMVTGALSATPAATRAVEALTGSGLLPDRLSVLAPLSLVMSNTIGNVPSVILLLKLWPAPDAGALYALALLSTFAGNLLLVGSLANIIVAERAAASGVRLGFAAHARAGIPVALISTALGAGWLWLIGAVPF